MNRGNHGDCSVLTLTLVLAALSCGLGLFLLLHHMANSPTPVTEVSEHRNNWQKSIVPRELFIRLDAHIMSLAKTDASLQAVLDELDEFFASREAIAGINEVD